MAAFNGHVGCLGPLNGNGANLNTTNKNGETALHLAAGKGHTAIINELLKIAPSLAKEKNKFGQTALDLACCKGHEEIAKVLRAADGNKAAPDRTGTVKARVLSDSDRSNYVRGFHDAAKNGDTGLIRKLLRNDSSLAKEKDNWGWTALHEAARWGHTEIVRKLVSVPEINVNEKDNDGKTPLHWAAEAGHREIVRELVYRGINVNERTKSGSTALHLAAMGGHTEIVEVLVRSGINVNERTKSGSTAFRLAALRGYTGCKKLLERYKQAAFYSGQ
nr:ankyrin repeat domain-containing protein [Endozoicomonas acroporae]